MDFIYHISTPAKTPETDPKKTLLQLTRGRLTGGWIYFPYGPAGYLHIILTRGIHQLFPFNVGQSLRLDDAIAPLSLGLFLDQPPYTIEALTWNDSLTLPHALTLSLFLDPFFSPEYDIYKIRTLEYPKAGE